MALVLYPLFAVLAFTFWVLVVGTVLVLYAAAYLGVFALTLMAMVVRSAWRPSRPRRPKALTAKRQREPQARYSDRR